MSEFVLVTEKLLDQVERLARKMRQASRKQQRLVLMTLWVETRMEAWPSNVVPACILSGHAATSKADALVRLGVAAKEEAPHQGYRLTALGLMVLREMNFQPLTKES